MSVRFEWDENNDRANIVKHGIGFDEARKVFSDPHLIIRQDRVVDGEERLHAIGYVERVLLRQPLIESRIILSQRKERRLPDFPVPTPGGQTGNRPKPDR